MSYPITESKFNGQNLPFCSELKPQNNTKWHPSPLQKEKELVSEKAKFKACLQRGIEFSGSHTKKALDCFCQAIAIDPKVDYEIWEKIIHCAKSNLMPDEQHLLFEKGHAVLPSESGMTAAYIESLAHAKKFDVIKKFQNIENEDVEIALAVAEFRAGHFEKGRELLYKLIDKYPQAKTAYKLAFYAEYHLGTIDRVTNIVIKFLKNIRDAKEHVIINIFQVIVDKFFPINEMLPNHRTFELVNRAKSAAAKGFIDLARPIFDEALRIAERGSKWKVIIEYGRCELFYGDKEKIFKFFQINCYVKKTKIAYYPLCKALLLERAGRIKEAKEIFQATKVKFGNKEWRTHFELALFEIRNGNKKDAEGTLLEAIQKFPFVGRLWQLYIELQYGQLQEEKIFQLLTMGLQSVPKSGELLTSLAAFYMNPLTFYYNLEKAEETLTQAIKCTQQYGDAYIELLRLKKLKGEKVDDLHLQSYAIFPSLNLRSLRKHGYQWEACLQDDHPRFSDVLKKAEEIVNDRMKSMAVFYKERKYDKIASFHLMSATGVMGSVWTKDFMGSIYYNLFDQNIDTYLLA